MATNSGMDIAEADHSYLPEEILMRIMAFLPFSSLFRSRSVSKAWNAFVLLPHFQKLRATLFKEFIVSVMNCTKLSSCRLMRSAGKVMIMARGPLDTSLDIFVVQPSIFSVRLLPHLDCALSIRNLDVFVVGLVVDDTTEEFTLFAISEFCPILRALVGGAAEPEVRRNLHHFNSATNVWSLCGGGELDLNATTMLGSYRDKKQVVGVVLHRGQYVALVRSTRDSLIPYHRDTYETFFYNGCQWERMRGVFPPIYIKGIVLFDHRGTLYFAAPSYSNCTLWSYGHETGRWISVRNFRFPTVPDIECKPGKWKSVTFPYAQAFGDFLHFGSFDPPDSPRMHMWEPPCRMVAYNLVSGKVEDIAHSQANVRMVTKASTGQKLLLQF